MTHSAQDIQRQGRQLYSQVNRLVALRKAESLEHLTLGGQVAMELDRLLSLGADAVLDAALTEAYEEGDAAAIETLTQFLEASSTARQFRTPTVITTQLVAIPVLIVRQGVDTLPGRATAGQGATLAALQAELSQQGLLAPGAKLNVEPYLYRPDELEALTYSATYELTQSLFGSPSALGAPLSRRLGQFAPGAEAPDQPELYRIDLRFLVMVGHTSHPEAGPLADLSSVEDYQGALERWMANGPVLIQELFGLPDAGRVSVGLMLPFYDAHRDGLTVHLQHNLIAAMSHALKSRRLLPDSVAAQIRPRLSDYQFVSFDIELRSVADNSLVASVSRPMLSFDTLQSALDTVYDVLAPFSFHSVQALSPVQADDLDGAPPGATVH